MDGSTAEEAVSLHEFGNGLFDDGHSKVAFDLSNRWNWATGFEGRRYSDDDVPNPAVWDPTTERWIITERILSIYQIPDPKDDNLRKLEFRVCTKTRIYQDGALLVPSKDYYHNGACVLIPEEFKTNENWGIIKPEASGVYLSGYDYRRLVGHGSYGGTTERESSRTVCYTPGRFLSRIQGETDPKQITAFERFCDRWAQGNSCLDWSVKFFSGKDVIRQYDKMDDWCHSCMTGDNSPYTELYGENPDRVQLAIVYDEKGNPAARTLVWTDEKGRKYVGRVYPSDSYRRHEAVRKLVREQIPEAEWLDEPPVIPMVLGPNCFVPYTDNHQYIYHESYDPGPGEIIYLADNYTNWRDYAIEKGINYKSYRESSPNAEGGPFVESENWQPCIDCGGRVHDEDGYYAYGGGEDDILCDRCFYSDRWVSVANMDYVVPRDLTELTWDGDYIYTEGNTEDYVYSERYSCYIHFDNAIQDDVDGDWIPAERAVEFLDEEGVWAGEAHPDNLYSGDDNRYYINEAAYEACRSREQEVPLGQA